ncbi:hypothetical protein XPA_000806 [Xanthoria parietina]
MLANLTPSRFRGCGWRSTCRHPRIQPTAFYRRMQHYSSQSSPLESCQRLMPATSTPPLSFATSLAPPTGIPVYLRGNSAEIIVLAPAVRQGRSDHVSTRPARFDINAYS